MIQNIVINDHLNNHEVGIVSAGRSSAHWRCTSMSARSHHLVGRPANAASWSRETRLSTTRAANTTASCSAHSRSTSSSNWDARNSLVLCPPIPQTAALPIPGPPAPATGTRGTPSSCARQYHRQLLCPFQVHQLQQLGREELPRPVPANT